MLAAAAMISFTACEKDGDEDGNDERLVNEMKIGDKSYPLAGGCCYYWMYDEEEQITRYEIYLSNHANEPGFVDGPQSRVNICYLYAKNTNQEIMPSGPYPYKTIVDDIPAVGRYHNGMSAYVLYDDNSNSGYWIKFGQKGSGASELEINVKHISGNIYEITFTNGYNGYGSTVRGHYKGEINMINDN